MSSHKIFIIATLFLLILFQSSCNKNEKEKQVNTVDTVKSIKKLDTLDNSQITKVKDYSDINNFWVDFAEAVEKNDKEKVTEMSFFPFLRQSELLYKNEFIDDYDNILKSLKKDIKNIKTPRKSGMFWEGGFDRKGKSVNIKWKQGSLKEVRAGSVTYYFGLDKNVFKMVGMLYGE